MENGKWELVALSTRWGKVLGFPFPVSLSLDGYPRFQGSKVVTAALGACSLMVKEDAVGMENRRAGNERTNLRSLKSCGRKFM